MQDLHIIIELVQSEATKRGVTVNKLFLESGVGKDFIANMKKGRIPAADKFCNLADFLDVSVDYLLGRTDKPEVNR